MPLFKSHAAETDTFFSEFKSSNNEIISLIETDEEYAQHDLVREKGDSLYFGVKAILAELEPPVKPLPSTLKPTAFQDTPLRLGKIDIPIFKGEIKQFNTFLELFLNLVDRNPQLSDIEKLFYLTTLLQDEPLRLVRTLPLVGSNYKIALDSLRSRYENKRGLATLYYSEMFNASALQRGAPDELRNLLCTFNENVAALKNLGFPTNSWCFLLFNWLLGKLDMKTRAAFESKFCEVDMPTYQQLLDYLESQCRVSETLYLNAGPKVKTLNPPFPKTGTVMNKKVVLVAQTENEKKPIKCILCSEEHQLYRCSVFSAKTVEDRYLIVKENQLCINCLSSSHMWRQCRSKLRCRQCRGPHHSLLHRTYGMSKQTDQATSAPVSNPQITESSTTPQEQKPETPVLPIVACSTAIATQSSTILLSTAEVQLKDQLGTFVTVRAMLDTGSMANFISKDCARQLGLKCSRSSVPIEGLNNMSLSNTQGIVSLFMKPVGNTVPTFELDAIVLPRICSDQPKVNFDLGQLTHLRNVKLADSRCNVPAPIDLLIGAELISYLVGTHRIFGSRNQPVAIESVFGYVLQGKLLCSPPSWTLQSLHVSLKPLDSCLRKFWEVESVEPYSPSAIVKPEEEACEALFAASIHREPSGRFSVALPFKNGEPRVGDTYPQAIRRLRQLEHRLVTKPDISSSYSEFLKDYLQSGHMSLVPQKECQSKTAIYIPHHCIIRPDSLTTKLRVVFDASAKGSLRRSLNDELYIGPKLQQDIFAILLNFRKPAIVFTCDIKQMFLQILIAEHHRDYQRILWRFSKDEPVQEYRLNTVTFGLASSPYLAQRTLIHLAELEQNRFPMAAAVIKRNVYVDDIAAGCDDITTTLQLRDELIALLGSGGFELRKWASNAAEILKGLPSLSQSPISFDSEEPQFVKVLGLEWDPAEDAFSYAFHPNDCICTKRAILSEIAKIFDPMGFLTPVVLTAKHVLQQLWGLRTDWDDSPPQQMKDYWIKFHGELHSLRYLQIPRQLLSPETTRVELHGFSDASQIGYGAVVYVRLQHPTGMFTTRICTAKSKVAPIRTISLPRLELLGAVLLTDLIQKIYDSSSFKFHSTTTWCDSQIVLYWLASHASRWKTFVSNRVARIHETLPHPHWRYVASGDNPADCASRGLFPSQLKDHPLWWRGPPWLSATPEAWPAQPSMVALPDSTLVEERIDSNLVTEEDPHPLQHLLENFSSLLKIQRIVAYVIRFGSRQHRLNRSSSLLPSQSELQDALLCLVSFVQRSSFENILKSLKRGSQLPKTFRKLSLFLDDRELIRVGGRLRHSDLQFEAKHPLLLPGDNPLSRLIIEHVHKTNLHPGIKTLSYLIVQQFWILSPRKVINRCLSRCYRCFKANPKTLTPPMADLPSFRVNQLRAFHTVCVDFAGPFLITMAKNRGVKSTKAYVCVFVCCAVKAIHLELVSDMTAEAFIAAFERFVSRRGPCYAIHSDQGTNFVGASNQLRKLAADASVQLKIEWHFNPPSAPHFNGLAEAGVRSVKTHLSRVVGEQVLTYEELYTLLTKIEAVLNSRPLSPMSSDPNDMLPLTPGHFLILEPLNSSVPEPDLSRLPSNRLNRWQLLNQMYGHFWDRWKKEYLHTLQQRSKWHRPVSQLEVGTMVLVKNDNRPPNHWAIARVSKVHPGADGVVRVVTLQGATGQFQRPVVKLCPLPQ